MAFIITVDQQFDAAVAFVDANGNVAPVDGIPVWSSSDDTILAVNGSADGMSCIASAAGPVGSAQLSVVGDADLGAGVVQVIALLDVSVVGGMAVAATISPGVPQDKLQINPLAP